MSEEPHLFVLALMRNEASRFLSQVLEVWTAFADDVLILDDGSTDGSVEIARSHGAEVVEMSEIDPAWGMEWPKRKRLFEAGTTRLNEGDYAFILDLDMIPLKDPRPLLSTEPDAVAFGLFDLWGQTDDGRLFYRTDGHWRAHLHSRVWLFRKPSEPPDGWTWNERGLHSGHLPMNFTADRVLYAPPDFSLLHLAYLTPALRRRKHSAYMGEADKLSEDEIAHAESILDEDVRLEPLKHEPEWPFARSLNPLD